VPVPRGSEALFLLQVVRDEAHRFANAFHRQVRGKRMKASALDDVDGLGVKRRERLLAHFGGLSGLKKATLEEILGLSWLPESIGKNVFDALHQ